MMVRSRGENGCQIWKLCTSNYSPFSGINRRFFLKELQEENQYEHVSFLLLHRTYPAGFCRSGALWEISMSLWIKVMWACVIQIQCWAKTKKGQKEIHHHIRACFHSLLLLFNASPYPECSNTYHYNNFVRNQCYLDITEGKMASSDSDFHKLSCSVEEVANLPIYVILAYYEAQPLWLVSSSQCSAKPKNGEWNKSWFMWLSVWCEHSHSFCQYKLVGYINLVTNRDETGFESQFYKYILHILDLVTFGERYLTPLFLLVISEIYNFLMPW